MPTFAEVLRATKAEIAADVAAIDAKILTESEARDQWGVGLAAASDAVAGARHRLERAKSETAAAIEHARSELAAARTTSVAATAARDDLLRAAYAGGATARALAEVAGISVPRVNQIVAGARG